jgi:hypothetical protein
MGESGGRGGGKLQIKTSLYALYSHTFVARIIMLTDLYNQEALAGALARGVLLPIHKSFH